MWLRKGKTLVAKLLRKRSLGTQRKFERMSDIKSLKNVVT
jgi:hypothetical protein